MENPAEGNPLRSPDRSSATGDPGAALNTIAGLGLDILHRPDVGMDALTYTLAFTRLAPIQCATWGHPVSTGLTTVDYFLSSRDLEVAEADGHYTSGWCDCRGWPSAASAPRHGRAAPIGTSSA